MKDSPIIFGVKPLVGSNDLHVSAYVTFFGKGPKIYFVAGLEVKAISEKTWEVSSVMNATEDILGIAVDALRNQIWWSSEVDIYRSEIGGTGTVALSLDTAECKLQTCLWSEIPR